MRSRRAQVPSIVLVAALLGASPPARAEPSAADVETARAEFNVGLGLRDKGDAAGALPHLVAANTLVPTPIIAVELGRTQLQLHLLVEALESFLSVARIPPRANESANSARARKDAVELASEVEPRIPSLTVHAKAGGATPVVMVDGVAIPAVASSAPRKLDPGKHDVVVRADGYVEQTQTVTLDERDTRELEFVLAPGGAPAKEPATSPNAATTTATHAGALDVARPDGGDELGAARPRSPLVWIGFGVAGVGAAVGAIAGIATLSKASKVKDECPDQRCTTPQGQSDLDAAHSLGAVSTVSFALAGAGVVVGVIGLLGGGAPATDSGGAHAQITPYLGLGGGGVRGSF